MTEVITPITLAWREPCSIMAIMIMIIAALLSRLIFFIFERTDCIFILVACDLIKSIASLFAELL